MIFVICGQNIKLLAEFIAFGGVSLLIKRGSHVFTFLNG